MKYEKFILKNKYITKPKMASLLSNPNFWIQAGRVFTVAKGAGKIATAGSAAYGAVKAGQMVLGRSNKVSTVKPGRVVAPLPKKATVTMNPGCITSSYAQYDKKKKPLGKSLKEKITEVAGSTIRSKTISTGRLTSTVGVIGYSEVQRNFDAGDLTVLQAQLPAVLNTGKFFAKQCHCTTTFKNQSTGETKLEIYEFRCKKDLPTTAVQNSLPNLWQTGIIDQGGAGADFVNYGSSPMDSELVRESFTLIKKTDLFLPGGSSHIHTTFSQPHKWINMEYILNNTGATTYAGLTTYTFVVCTGMPSNDITTKTQVSCSPCAVDWISVQEYLVSGLGTTRTVYSANATALPTSFTVGESRLDEDGDIVTGANLSA